MNPSTSIRDIAVAIPGSVRVFEKYQIDFCCHGRRPLEEACREQGLSPEAVLGEIARLNAAAAPARDWTRESLSALIAHIIGRHHQYLKDELPNLEARIEKVLSKHGETSPGLHQVREVFLGLAAELAGHLRKEEMILFPYIEQMEAGEPGGSCFGSVANPIRMMLLEHDSAGAALADLRRLTDSYTPPETACPTYRAMLHELAALEADLHQHIHLENNILFPRALELEKPR